jgi:hypothetical protein
MVDTIEFQSEFGPVEIAVRRTGADYGDQEVARLQDVIIDSALSIEQSLAIIRPLAEAVLAQVSVLARRAEEVQVEVGLEIGGKGKFVVAEAHATASLKVTLTWKNPA